MIDDQDLNGPFGRFEFQAELLLEGGEEIGIFNRVVFPGTGAAELGFVWSPCEVEVVAAREFGLIDDGAIQGCALEHGSQLGHSGIAAR